MPIYEYTCPKCGKLFEELVPLRRADEPVPCPSCGEEKTQRNLTSCAAPVSSRSSPSASGCASGGHVG